MTTFDDLVVGTTYPPRVDPPLTLTDVVRYQGASGDLNPIHHDSAYARAAGYRGPFSVGMLQAGRLATYVTNWLGPRNARRFMVRFQELAWPGDVLTYTACIAQRDETRRTVEVELACLLPDGTAHITGAATFVVPDD